MRAGKVSWCCSCFGEYPSLDQFFKDHRKFMFWYELGDLAGNKKPGIVAGLLQ
jgi:hypothetical protein